MAFKTLREFIQLETSGGIVLFVAAVLALIVSNSFLEPGYHALFDMPVVVMVGDLAINKPLLLWINDGLMTIFFLLVGLEIKRELVEGELSSLKNATLPFVAAIGGMLVPALIYLYFTKGDPVALHGWAIPAATDIAFSLGILALLGSRIPISLKIFLTAVAIFDDVGAIMIIATFYTKHISIELLFGALICFLALILFNRFKIMRFPPYILVGIVMWLFVLKSGVHATLAGILLAFCIPLRDHRYPDVSPLRQLEHRLHPWVAFGVLPIFAFANSGVSLKGLSYDHFTHPVQLGIACGLFFGKQIGIWLASYLAIMFGIAKLPKGSNWLGVYGISLIAGVGFTMSLFIGTLAFSGYSGDYAVLVRMGVITGSVFAGLFGYLVLRWSHPSHSLLHAKTLDE